MKQENLWVLGHRVLHVRNWGPTDCASPDPQDNACLPPVQKLAESNGAFLGEGERGLEVQQQSEKPVPGRPVRGLRMPRGFKLQRALQSLRWGDFDSVPGSPQGGCPRSPPGGGSYALCQNTDGRVLGTRTSEPFLRAPWFMAGFGG